MQQLFLSISNKYFQQHQKHLWLLVHQRGWCLKKGTETTKLHIKKLYFGIFSSSAMVTERPWIFCKDKKSDHKKSSGKGRSKHRSKKSSSCAKQSHYDEQLPTERKRNQKTENIFCDCCDGKLRAAVGVSCCSAHLCRRSPDVFLCAFHLILLFTFSHNFYIILVPILLHYLPILGVQSSR